MSSTTPTQVDERDNIETYLQRWERENLAELAKRYPSETRSLTIELADLERYDARLADRVLNLPDVITPQFENAVTDHDLPVDQPLGNANVRFVTTDRDQLSAGRVAEADAGDYVGVTGILEQVGPRVERMEEATFICQRCGTPTNIPQSFTDPSDPTRQSPHECVGCERQGPFEVDFDKSEFVDYRMLRIAQPPGEGASGDQLHVDCWVEDDAVNVGCVTDPEKATPLSHRAGEQIVAHGIVHSVPESDDSLLFEKVLEARALTFPQSQKEVADCPRSEITEVATGEDSGERFRADMAPGIYDTGAWDLIKHVTEAFLFAAPTINLDGEGKRGNIHMFIPGAPGLGKSQFMQSARSLSVEAAYVSAAGKQVSEVGFTAATVKDDFGGEGFSLKPGVLPRAGWHAYIDEIDKFSGEVTSLNDALEFPQQISIEKGGIRATLETECGVMMMGNPKGGRFDPDVDVWTQIREVVDPSLLSRFDAVIPLRDVPDQEQDEHIADHMLTHHREQAQRAQGKLDADEADVSKRDLPVEFLRRWLVEGRKIDPLLTDGAHDTLREFFPKDRGAGDGETPNYTFRKLDAGIRFTKAFARRDLSEDATKEHAEEAISVLKPLIGLTHDGEGGFDPDVVAHDEWSTQDDTPDYTRSQEERRDDLTEICTELDAEHETKFPQERIYEAAAEMGYGREDVNPFISDAKNKGWMSITTDEQVEWFGPS